MAITSVPFIGETVRSAIQSLGSNVQNFAISVQRAVGPKELSGYGMEGSVLVAFSLGNDGALAAVRIARSSGHQQLDSAALHLVGRALFPTPPVGISVIHRTFVSAFAFT